MEKIESFEPYHIGIKLRFPLDYTILNGLKTTISKDSKFKLLPEPQPNSPIIDVAKEGTTIIQVNLPSNAINTIGTDIKEVTSVNNKLIGFLKTIGLDLDSTISFYELTTSITIKTEKNPLEVLESSAKVNVMNEFSPFDISVTGFKISKKEVTNDNELFDLIIEPKAISPKERYFISLVLRSQKREKIIQFSDNIKNFVESLIKSLEEIVNDG